MQKRSVEDMLNLGDWRGLAQRLGFEARPLRLCSGTLAGWGLGMLEGYGVTLMTSGPGVRLLVVDGDPEHGTSRAAMRAAHRRNPEDVTLWWWVSAHRVVVTFGCGRSDGGFDVRRMVIARDEPERMSLQQLEGLSIRESVSPDERERGRAVRRHFENVLDQEAVTRAFFTGFREAVALLKTTMTAGPDEDSERHTIALSTMLRLLFMYFLQSRNALNNDPKFLLRSWRARPRDSSFYRSSLRPLFFGALNTPLQDREQRVKELGTVPFLNGGLFDPTPVELRHPALDWPDTVWNRVLDELFERYHFDLGTPAENQSSSIDPEMLGKVFEGLMYGDARARTGSFYTPVDVVNSMVRRGLEHHIQQETSWKSDRISALWDATFVDLDTRDGLRAALQKLRILDPAAGTGAFLLEALQRLRHLWTLIDGPVDHVRLRELVHNHIFGVDINFTATRLCELRIWIALLEATPDHAVSTMPPLPNLSHRIVTGDALIEVSDLVERRTKRGAMAGSRILRGSTARQLNETQKTFLTCHGAQKAALRAELERAESKLTSEILENRLRRLKLDEAHLVTLSEHRDMFGVAAPPKDTAKSLKSVRAELSGLEALLGRILEYDDAFLLTWAAKFPEVFSEAGFDLILTNPPWVRAHRVERTRSAVLGARYQSTRSTLWKSAKSRGIRVPFGAQVDLANVFLERSLELLKPEGHLVALVPSKMFRSLQGTGIRRILGTHQVLGIEDFSEASRTMFDATTYPACLHVRRSKGHRHSQVKVWAGEGFQTWEQKFPIDGSPWVLVPPKIHKILAKMHQNGPAHFEPQRGIFTGANHVFVGEQDALLHQIGNDVRPFLRPVLKGSDPGGTKEVIVWPYDAEGKELAKLPDNVASWFAKHARILGKRSDHDPAKPLWQTFRVRPDTLSAKVVWRDIAPGLVPSVATEGSVPLNTVYYLPCQSDEHAQSLSELLGSLPMRAASRAYSERARGGYRRHFAWCIRMLPVSEGLLKETEQGVPMNDEYVAASLGLDAHDLQTLKEWAEGDSRSDMSHAA
jgi:hypothetical protein